MKASSGSRNVQHTARLKANASPHTSSFCRLQLLFPARLRSNCDMEGSTDAKTDVYHEVAYEPEDDLVFEKRGTEHDAHDMARMGKVQLLRVWL